jgi:gluconokinase
VLRVIVVMGVSGAGKTTVGIPLAASLGWPFYDADDFHSVENIAKMHRGEGLTDDDRRPWLTALCALIHRVVTHGEHAVLACSALKQWYREALVPPDVDPNAIQFVYLDVPEEVLRQRLAARVGHFAPPALVGSQLATLEEPMDAVRIEGTLPVDSIVRAVRASLTV